MQGKSSIRIMWAPYSAVKLLQICLHPAVLSFILKFHWSGSEMGSELMACTQGRLRCGQHIEWSASSCHILPLPLTPLPHAFPLLCVPLRSLSRKQSLLTHFNGIKCAQRDTPPREAPPGPGCCSLSLPSPPCERYLGPLQRTLVPWVCGVNNRMVRLTGSHISLEHPRPAESVADDGSIMLHWWRFIGLEDDSGQRRSPRLLQALKVLPPPPFSTSVYVMVWEGLVADGVQPYIRQGSISETAVNYMQAMNHYHVKGLKTRCILYTCLSTRLGHDSSCRHRLRVFTRPYLTQGITLAYLWAGSSIFHMHET